MNVALTPRRYDVIKKIKKKLYIIYLALIADPIIDHERYFWVHKVFKNLYSNIQYYLKNCSIDHLSIENQLHLLQYYLKIHLTLNIKISPSDDNLFGGFLNKLLGDPSFSNIC
ncbi:hypothetical protein RF11_05306 [Thelohanellus kitauei]|uniref:Uncharacterized protein n=1 Tax=Thelohanellus kitauei TaxID=669202 RepID=A0A0C2JI46_THEKT|nr:hypothetical protein RF11_05306 [Thelohanellus kitauei]